MNQFPHGFKAEANRIALSVRADLGLRPESALDPWKLSEHFEIEVSSLSELVGEDGKLIGSYFLELRPDLFSAMTVPCGMKRKIVLNDSHSKYRQASSLAHEIAHALLGHIATPPLTAERERKYDRGIEAAANLLGSYLLIPNEAAIHIVRHRLTHETFGVSEEMLAYRVRTSGALIRHERASRLWREKPIAPPGPTAAIRLPRR